MTSYELSSAEQAFLDARGYRLEDVVAWANIVTLTDSIDVLDAIEEHITLRGSTAIPLFLLNYILRRRHIRAQALRRLIPLLRQTLVRHTSADTRSMALPPDAIFLVFIRMVRHARQVLPACLESLTEMLLFFLPRSAFFRGSMSPQKLSALGFLLNKAMQLLSLPVSLSPFKNFRVQEAAVVRILQYMSEHDPTLMINRAGYRAVVVLQLAAPKTANDRLWAELKALSWPPWKQDRTAVDAHYTRESHGTPKAAATLKLMLEAGYKPLDFEKVARVYAGWDTDDTPTIQKRAFLRTRGLHFRVGAALWAARIDTTRTVQEAWACYEAFEKERHQHKVAETERAEQSTIYPQNDLPSAGERTAEDMSEGSPAAEATDAPWQCVYLAMFRKLAAEQRRVHAESGSHRRKGPSEWRRLYPGDTQEISPLPPSTHLYTYTHRPPPSLHAFYMEMAGRGVIFDEECVVVLIEFAQSITQGIQYLYENRTRALRKRKAIETKESRSKLSDRLFVALIMLLCRFSTHSMPLPAWTMLREMGLTGNFRHRDTSEALRIPAILHCISLLERSKSTYRPAWQKVLYSLGFETSFRGFQRVSQPRRPMNALSRNDDRSYTRQVWEAASIAYQKSRYLVSMMKECDLDVDEHCFHALCNATENLVLSCWHTLRYEKIYPQHSDVESEQWAEKSEVMPLVQEVRDAGKALREDFISVYEAKDDNRLDGPEASTEMELQHLKQIPGPSYLHAYIRALGWLRDYTSLLETVRWMAKHKDELAQVRSLDHNGVPMMRKALIAFRVFLERSFLPDGDMQPEDDPAVQPDQEVSDLAEFLASLQTPADTEIIQEAQRLVESVEDWGGWPTTDEVQRYCENYRFARFQL
jgi:hypothetical protein